MSGSNNLRSAAIIVLFGPTGTGKTTFANVASDGSMRVGCGLTSCTQEIRPTSMFTVDGKPVILIDSPGFDDTDASDAEILNSIAGFLSYAYSQRFKINGLIYMHKITDTRVGGKALLHMNMFREICGLDALSSVAYVTNMWSRPPTQDELAREAELRTSDRFFAMPLARGAQMCRHNNTQKSAYDIIRRLLSRAPRVTKLAKELVDDRLSLEKTRAGTMLGVGIENEIKRLNDQITRLRESHARAMRESNEGHQKEIREQVRRTEGVRRKLERDIERLKQGHEKDAAEWRKLLNDSSAGVANAMTDLVDTYRQEIVEARMSEADRRKELIDAYSAALEAQRRRGACIIA